MKNAAEKHHVRVKIQWSCIIEHSLKQCRGSYPAASIWFRNWGVEYLKFLNDVSSHLHTQN